MGSYWAVALAGTASGRRVLHRSLLSRGPAGTLNVALTFDDGPDPTYTPRFIDALGDAACTFFVLGERAGQWPSVVRGVVDAGHEVGCHGNRHDRLTRLSPAATIRDLRSGHAAITAAAGAAPLYYRPPHGVFNLAAWLEAPRLGMHRTLWSGSAGDWRSEATPDSIAEATLRSAVPGAVIVMHDSGGWPDRPAATLQAIPLILAGLADKGLRPVTLTRLLSGT